jgi:hypothetical protein
LVAIGATDDDDEVSAVVQGVDFEVGITVEEAEENREERRPSTSAELDGIAYVGIAVDVDNEEEETGEHPGPSITCASRFASAAFDGAVWAEEIEATARRRAVSNFIFGYSGELGLLIGIVFGVKG